MINRMICQTAPEERPETRIRFAVFFLHWIALLAAGNILSILLILSKNLGDSMRCAEYACSNCLPTQNSEEPFFFFPRLYKSAQGG